MLYHTCTILFFSGFLTWLKMDLRSCTLYYNFTSASKTLEMPFQCTKKKFRVAYLRTSLIWSPSPHFLGWIDALGHQYQNKFILFTLFKTRRFYSSSGECWRLNGLKVFHPHLDFHIYIFTRHHSRS